MKISIITASFNCAQTIEDCIKSIVKQTYSDIEHIIIDGGSKDGTMEIINKYGDRIARMVSEPDRGIYDAMNKGLRYATGDIIGILNSDDVYADEFVLENITNAISEHNDSCYGDLVYVERDNTEKVVRNWKGGEFNRQNFLRGWMPPHPTFFAKKEVYQKYGVFNTDFPIAADYELMLRFLYKYNISSIYIPRLLVKMRTGGKSKPELGRIAKNMIENYRAWKVNGLEVNPLTFIMKPLSKAVQYMKSSPLRM